MLAISHVAWGRELGPACITLIYGGLLQQRLCSYPIPAWSIGLRHALLLQARNACMRLHEGPRSDIRTLHHCMSAALITAYAASGRWIRCQIWYAFGQRLGHGRNRILYDSKAEFWLTVLISASGKNDDATTAYAHACV
jgi:hypothetical protein